MQFNDVQKYEFKVMMDQYHATIPNVPGKTVAEIVTSGKYHPALDKFLNTAAGLSRRYVQHRLQSQA